jgi:hypothetical protein
MARRGPRGEVDEQWEVELDASLHSDSWLYQHRIVPTWRQLANRKANGTYDRAKALKAFRSVVDEGTRRYRTENMLPTDPLPNVPTRNAVAEIFLDYFEVEWKLGNMNYLLSPTNKARLEKNPSRQRAVGPAKRAAKRSAKRSAKRPAKTSAKRSAKRTAKPAKRSRAKLTILKPAAKRARQKAWNRYQHQHAGEGKSRAALGRAFKRAHPLPKGKGRARHVGAAPEYVDVESVAEHRWSEPGKYGHTRAGYTKRSGAPTALEIRLKGERRWRRVMVWQTGNAGTTFVKIDGKPRVIVVPYTWK